MSLQGHGSRRRLMRLENVELPHDSSLWLAETEGMDRKMETSISLKVI